MNILVPYSWLKDYLKTDVLAEDLAEKLSLCGPSVERIERVNGDFVFEIEVTTNRSDLLSVLGIAREAAAILPQFGIKAEFINKLKDIKPFSKEMQDNLPLDIKIQNSKLCPRFTAIILDNVQVKPSSKIIKERLEKIGARPLNNVIDITNYLMFELGQPIHAFDYDKIKNHHLFLRESRQDETITTLDGVERKLPTASIVIEDERRLIDLCGIMGGANSEIDEKTRRVLLFVQTYNSQKIRKTSQALAFRTEAALRFEKGVDIEGIVPSLWQVVSLLKQEANARVASDIIDIYPALQKPKTVVLEIKKLQEVLGVEIGFEKATQILKSLGFECDADNQIIKAKIPSFRYGDVNIGEDLIEEIARIYGYHNLPANLPSGEIPVAPQNLEFYFEERVKTALKYWGYTEVYTYSLVSEELASQGLTLRGWPLKNPLTEDLKYLRTSLVFSILAVVKANRNNFPQIKIFEMAKVYLPCENDLPKEQIMLTIADTEANFYQVKGVIQGLLEDLGIEATWRRGSEKSAQVVSKQKILGLVKKIDDIWVADLNFSLIWTLAKLQKTYTPLPKFPPVLEDLSMIVEKTTPVGEILETIKKVDPQISKVLIFDLFEDEKLGKNKKSVAIRITYQAEDKTLSTKEVEGIREKIITNLEKILKVQIRKG